MTCSYKEVYFNEYCHKCSNKLKPENDTPCCECLSVPARFDSHKPLYFDEDQKRKNNHD